MAVQCDWVRSNWYQSGPVLEGRDVAGKSSNVSENRKVQNESVESRLNRIEMGVKETYRKLEAGLLVGDETWKKNLITKLEWMRKEIEEIRREEAEGKTKEEEEEEKSVESSVVTDGSKEVEKCRVPVNGEEEEENQTQTLDPTGKKIEKNIMKEKMKMKGEVPEESPREHPDKSGGGSINHQLVVVALGSSSRRKKNFKKEGCAGASGSGGGPGEGLSDELKEGGVGDHRRLAACKQRAFEECGGGRKEGRKKRKKKKRKWKRREEEGTGVRPPGCTRVRWELWRMRMGKILGTFSKGLQVGELTKGQPRYWAEGVNGWKGKRKRKKKKGKRISGQRNGASSPKGWKKIIKKRSKPIAGQDMGLKVHTD